MEGCNYWVEGGQPRGLIPPWLPCVDHEPMHPSIGPCHNIGSCARLISAGTVQASHSLLLPIAATIGQAPHRLPSVRGRRIQPDPAVARCVWWVGALGDDAFQTQLAGVRG